MRILRKLVPRRRRAEGYPGKGLFGRPAPRRSAEVDRERCRGCGDCETICHYRRIRVRRDGKARVARGCIGCGACARICSNAAVTMVGSSSSGDGTSG